MNKNACSLYTVNKILLILLIILVGTTIKVYPYYQFSHEPSSYQGEGVYRTQYMLDNGHAVSSQRGEVILDKLGLIKQLVIDLSPKQNMLVTSFFLSLAFSLVIYLFANNFSKEKRIDIWTTGLIIAFSISGSPDINVNLIGWNGPYTWIFIMLFLYFNIYKNQTASMITLSLISLLLLPPTYYTISLFFALFFAVSVVLQSIDKAGIVNKKMFNNYYSSIFTKNVTILYFVFLVSWLIYMSDSGFSSLFNLIDFSQSYFQHESRVITLGYIAYGSPFSMVKNAISIVLSSIPFIYVLYYGRKCTDPKTYNLIWITFGAIFVMSLILYLWMGFMGILQRIPGYVSIFSVLAFSLLSSSKINPNHFRFLKIIIMLAVVSSTLTYLTSDYVPDKPTFSEAEGAHWLIQKISKENLTYTDFRLASLFIAKGYPTLYVEDNILPSQKVDIILKKTFYEVDQSTAKILNQLTAGSKPIEYIYFSNRYTKRFPGIKGYDYNYLPAPKNFIGKYEDRKEFNTIYKNSDITVFTLNE